MNIEKQHLATHTAGSEYPSFALRSLDETMRHTLEPPHSNSFFQIVLLEEGSADYFIGFEHHAISSPAICFIFPRQVSSLIFSKHARGAVLMFDETIFCSAILSNELREYNVDLYKKVNLVSYAEKQAAFADILQMKQHIEELARPLNNIRQMELKFLVKIIIFKIIDSISYHEFSATVDQDHDTYLSFRKLIDEHYHSQRKVEYYCHQLGITAKKLNLLCKKYAHNTALELIHDRLTAELKRCLIFENAPLKHIAFDLGFESQSSLNKYIMAKFACSPSQLKEKLRRDNTMISSILEDG